MSIVRDSSIGFAIGNAMGLPVEGESREKKIQEVTEDDEELELPSFLRNRDF